MAAAAARRGGSLAALWDWIGWHVPRIAWYRTEAAGARIKAEQAAARSHTRAEASGRMSDWLHRRSERNHIAEQLKAAFNDPREHTP